VVHALAVLSANRALLLAKDAGAMLTVISARSCALGLLSGLLRMMLATTVHTLAVLSADWALLLAKDSGAMLTVISA
jgi:hypothetical protein